MKLSFEIAKEIGIGSYPDLLHMYDNEAQAIYLKNGLMYGKTTLTPYGEWSDRVFEPEINILNLDNLSHFEINKLGGFGAIGVVKNGNSHKLLIYEFQQDVSEYLKNASIKLSTGNPISSFSLSLENSKHPNEEHQGNIVMDEKNNALQPGSKIIFKFGMGDGIPNYELGTYYVDRADFTLLSETANIDGRNLIGKALKDQTLNGNSKTQLEAVSEKLKDMLKNANLKRNDYIVQNTSKKLKFEFEPKETVSSAIDEILKAMVNWQMEERVDGTIVIGEPDFSGFQSRGIYTFNRNKDIFSRQIVSDDQSSYRKVCVHDSKWTVEVYEDVVVYTGWNLQSNKTLFVKVADGTSIANAQAIAVEIASRLENVGKIESFSGPFRPHLLTGDEARIIDEEGSTSLGLITEITHSFGKSGFSTSFTVDSGGRLGKGSLSDYINLLNNSSESGSIGYEDIIN